MINPAVCQRVYPIIRGTYKVYYVVPGGGRIDVTLPYRAWVRCDNPSAHHVVDYIDPEKPGTALVSHLCEDCHAGNGKAA